MTYTLHHGDCLEVMAGLDPVDAIVTDPPYHLTTGKKGGSGLTSDNPSHPAGRARITTGFMGKAWDGGDIAHDPVLWAETLRVLKPGAHLLAFGGTRTFHRLTCAIEDAGFEIRDCLMWLYGSGFPKSLDVSKAMDKAAGEVRPRVPGGQGGTNTILGQRKSGEAISGEAISGEAIRWQGWGTALKPAWEPIILARKPLQGTVAVNVAQHGTGALNVDGCRVEWQSVEDAAAAVGYAKSMERGTVADPTSLPTRYDKPPYEPEQMTGRWPANVLLDDEAGPMLDEQADTGGVSRFFYCAKASRAERDAGLAGVTPKPLHWSSGSQSPGTFQSPGTDRTARNNHPTVKPVALIRYLTRLVTPPGGTVLDPFMGSGTTGVACADEGFNFIGIEREAEYVEVARRRIEAAQAQQRLFA